MKESNGFTKLWPSVAVFIFYGLCLGGLTLAMEKVELGVAYSVWAGLGTAIIVTFGIFYYGEPASLAKLISIGLIIAGVAGLKLASP